MSRRKKSRKENKTKKKKIHIIKTQTTAKTPTETNLAYFETKSKM